MQTLARGRPVRLEEPIPLEFELVFSNSSVCLTSIPNKSPASRLTRSLFLAAGLFGITRRLTSLPDVELEKKLQQENQFGPDPVSSLWRAFEVAANHVTADFADDADKHNKPNCDSSAKSAVKTPLFETGEQLLQLLQRIHATERDAASQSDLCQGRIAGGCNF